MKLENNNEEFTHAALWAERLLRTELKALQREHEHLELKRRERELSKWELERVTHILDEVMELLRQISRATYELQAANRGEGDSSKQRLF